MIIDFAKQDFGSEEIDAVLRVLNSNWLAAGPENEAFEIEFAKYIGTKYAICVNSGTSANLLALASLGLPKGSKVLTSACGFPATLSPILHLGLEPVLVDYNIHTLNIDTHQVLEKMKGVQAIIIAHSLGNPVDLTAIKEKANELGIPLIEDCCEAVGSSIHGAPVGRSATLATYSFYPAHQMTACGAGGMITTNDEGLSRKIKSLRDWGKTADWDIKLGHSTTKYDSKVGDIPYFKHYIYETIGYNMKLPDVCAAFGRCQIKKLDEIAESRMSNYRYIDPLVREMNGMFYDLEVDIGAIASWFGYPLTIKNTKPGLRNSLGDALEEAGIRHRPFFAGNITKHKPFSHLKGHFPVADKIMDSTLFFGIWQGMTREQLDYIVNTVRKWTTSQS